MILSTAHWVFLAVTVAMLLALAIRQGVIILAMAGIVILALLSPNSGHDLIDKVIFCAQAMFRTAIVGGSRLFDTILLVGFLGALLHLLREEGICDVMMAPFERVMRGPRSAFLTLAAVTCATSLFFWPTPAVLMVGALLVPAARRAGLSAASAGMTISIAAFGLALSADPVVQAAPRITGAPGALTPSSILPIAAMLSLIAGAIALGIAFLRVGKDADPAPALTQVDVPLDQADRKPATIRQTMLAITIPILLAATLLFSLSRPVTTADDGTAVALLGGMAVMLLIVTCFVQHKAHALDHIVDMMTEGFFIVIRIFAPVVPVLGFFMIGDATSAPQILGEGTPGYIQGLALHLGCAGPYWSILLPVLIVLVGAVAGRDGVAFTGLPLVGAIATMLSGGNPHQGAILASLGQLVTIWIGAGVYLHWSGVRTVAAQVGMTREHLSQANHAPVIVGIGAATIAATVMLYRTCVGF